MAAGLGKAFIEIHADTRPFNKELAALLGVAIAQAEAAVRPKAKQLGEEIGEATAEGVKRSSREVSSTMREEIEKLKSEFKFDVDVDVDRNRIRRLFANFGSQFTSFGKGLFTNFFKGLSSAGGAFKSLVANIFNVPANSPLATVLAVLVTILLPALIGLATLAAAALSDLVGFLGLVPGALAVILGVVAPLIIAFHGLGEALELVFEKDPEKLKEGLAGLTPVMGNLVTMLRKFAPIFSDIQKRVQNAFFTPILKTLEPALKKLLPIISKGFQQVAGGVGRILADLIGLMNSPVFTNFLKDLFPAIERFTKLLGPPILSIFHALTIVAHESLPLIERLIQGFGTFLERFSGFILESIQNGAFDLFIENAVKGMDRLLELSGALLDLFNVIFDELDEEGRGLVDMFTALIRDLTDFFRSPEGREFLRDLSDSALLFVQVMRDVIPVTLVILDIVLKIVNGLLAAWAVFNKLIKGVDALLGKSQNVGSSLGGIASRVVGIPKFAEGGMVPKATIASLAEDGPEVVIPLNKPQRAAEIMQKAGLSSFGNVTVVAQFGTETIEAMSVRVVDHKFGQQARDLAYGPRGS